jgi:hypothetical protein
VNGYHLVVLRGEVVALLLQMRYLHEQPSCQAPLEVQVVVGGAEVSAHLAGREGRVRDSNE